MQTLTIDNTSSARAGFGSRLVLMGSIVGGLIAGSSWTRRLPPGRSLTIWINLLFFVALGISDELVLAPKLDRLPVGRAAALIAETLVLGWFFSPGRDKPASKMLFFAHIGPFFLAVCGGALCVLLLQRQRSRVS